MISLLRFFILLFVVVNYAHAASFEQSNQLSQICPDTDATFTEVEGAVAFKGSKQTLYLLQNKSEQDLWLVHDVPDPGAGAGWTSLLKAKQFSAIMVNREQFALQCVEKKPGSQQYVACQDVLSVCTWPDPDLLQAKKGTYWVAEDMPFDDLKIAIKNRRIKL